MKSRVLFVDNLKMDKQNKKGRPSKKQEAIIAVRNKEIVEMYRKNFPLDYMVAYFNLSKSTIVNIYKKVNK